MPDCKTDRVDGEDEAGSHYWGHWGQSQTFFSLGRCKVPSSAACAPRLGPAGPRPSPPNPHIGTGFCISAGPGRTWLPASIPTPSPAGSWVPGPCHPHAAGWSLSVNKQDPQDPQSCQDPGNCASKHQAESPLVIKTRLSQSQVHHIPGAASFTRPSPPAATQALTAAGPSTQPQHPLSEAARFSLNTWHNSNRAFFSGNAAHSHGTSRPICCEERNPPVAERVCACLLKNNEGKRSDFRLSWETCPGNLDK